MLNILTGGKFMGNNLALFEAKAIRKIWIE